jgi:hypothetical protein
MNKLKRYAGTFAVLVVTGVLMFGGSTAFGKSKVSKGAPKIKTTMPWTAVVYSVVALTGICVVAFKSPRRTRSDSD